VSERYFDAAFLQRLERLALVARRTLRGLGRGDRRSKRAGGSVEFSDYRRYAWGDEVRRIDWYAYARFETLFLKLFVEEQDLAVHVLVDASASMRTGTPAKLGYALRAAAALGYVALAAGDRLSLRAFVGAESSPPFGPARGRGRLPRLLQHLERTGSPGGKTSLAGAAAAFLARRPEPGVVLLISDLLDGDGYEKPLARLRAAGHEPFILQLAAPEEVAPALGDEHDLVDAETGEVVPVTLDRTAVRAYAERFRAFVAGVELFAKKLEIGHILVRTDLPFEALVLELCQRRALAS
jgi:uncharacterized protein (DUF58 family)